MNFSELSDTTLDESSVQTRARPSIHPKAYFRSYDAMGEDFEIWQNLKMERSTTLVGPITYKKLLDCFVVEIESDPNGDMLENEICSILFSKDTRKSVGDHSSPCLSNVAYLKQLAIPAQPEKPEVKGAPGICGAHKTRCVAGGGEPKQNDSSVTVNREMNLMPKN